MIYDYECTKCGHTTEWMTSKHNLKQIDCPNCNGKAVKVLSAQVTFRGEKDWQNYKVKDVPYE